MASELDDLYCSYCSKTVNSALVTCNDCEADMNKEDDAIQSAYDALLKEAEALAGALKHTYIEHNHITRDIKPVGECPSCDKYHALSDWQKFKDRGEKW